MTTTNDEFLSALVDDELGHFEQRRLLDEVTSNPEARARWGRYHLIGEALRGGLPPRTEMDFAARVRSALEAEKPLEVDRASMVKTTGALRAGAAVTRPVLGLAMAASVAAVTVLGVQALLGGRDGADTTLAGAAAPVVEPAPGPVSTPALATAPVAVSSRAAPPPTTALASTDQPNLWSVSAGDAVRLNSYLVTHSEHAALPGMLPQVRVVGYAGEQD